MGMDCMGDNPQSKQGEYFRANIWSWGPIHHLICHYCDQHKNVFGRTLIDDETLTHMSVNDGEGPADHKTCEILADYLDSYLKNEMDGDVLECEYGPYVCTETGKFLSDYESGQASETRRAYRVDRDHLQEFVGFLKECGGFRVY